MIRDTKETKNKLRSVCEAVITPAEPAKACDPRQRYQRDIQDVKKHESKDWAETQHEMLLRILRTTRRTSKRSTGMGVHSDGVCESVK